MEPSHRSSHHGRILLLVCWSVSVGEVNSAQGTDGRTQGLSLLRNPHPPGLGLVSQHPLRPPASGQWATWGSWSACSSECGEGASVRTRRCIRLRMERRCAGDGRQYRVCAMQACPPDVIPFRAMQCALYNSKPVMGSQERYEWVPFLAAPNPCDLICQAVGHSFYHTFGRVLDGTKCLADSEGMCINGQCLISLLQPLWSEALFYPLTSDGWTYSQDLSPAVIYTMAPSVVQSVEVVWCAECKYEVASCDGVLGSSISEDKCGQCQGRTGACVFIHRVFRAAFPSSGFFGYKNVTRVPAGATHVKVTDRSRNLLALMNARRRYVINGDWAVSWPGVYEVAGTQVHYTRSPDDHEVMEALGPTEEDLHVMLLFQEQNPGVEYEYWLPRDLSSTFHGGASALRQPQPRQEDLGFWNTAAPDQKRATPMSGPLHTPERPAGGCGECKQVSDKSQQIQSYCRSDFVFRARIVKKRLIGHETRYDVRVKQSYKKRYPIVHREYIWVPDPCDCPRLMERRDYLLMAQRHLNSERIVLDRHSYTTLWTTQEVLKLQELQRHCTSEGTDAA